MMSNGKKLGHPLAPNEDVLYSKFCMEKFGKTSSFVGIRGLNADKFGETLPMATPSQA